MARPLLLTFFRKNVDMASLGMAPRRLARINTALPRAIQLLVMNGQPGDVAEIAHAEFGFQIATIRIHVGGRFTIQLMEQ